MNDRRPLRHAWTSDIPEARALMRQGLSLRQTADILDVFSADLDHLMWAYLGIPDDEIGRRYRPMF